MLSLINFFCPTKMILKDTTTWSMSTKYNPKIIISKSVRFLMSRVDGSASFESWIESARRLKISSSC